MYWSEVAGQRLNMGGASAYIDHADAVGSTTMETDPAGGVQWKIAYYPWGQVLAQGGTRQSVVWAGLDWQVNDPSIPSATREYNIRDYRWLTPDPGGRKVVKLDNPQTWNMYSYVGNNPTSRNDPSGLYTANCNEDVKKCTKQINNFNKSLLSALKSKNVSIRAAAAAYGKLGEKNGVNVTFAKVVDAKHGNVVGTTSARAGTPGFTFDEKFLELVHRFLGNQDAQLAREQLGQQRVPQRAPCALSTSVNASILDRHQSSFLDGMVVSVRTCTPSRLPVFSHATADVIMDTRPL